MLLIVLNFNVDIYGYLIGLLFEEKKLAKIVLKICSVSAQSVISLKEISNCSKTKKQPYFLIEKRKGFHCNIRFSLILLQSRILLLDNTIFYLRSGSDSRTSPQSNSLNDFEFLQCILCFNLLESF